MRKIKLAVDIMGGDHGPSTTINGIYQASKLYPNVTFRLFGNEELALKEINKFSDFKSYQIIHTTELLSLMMSQ